MIPIKLHFAVGLPTLGALAGLLGSLSASAAPLTFTGPGDPWSTVASLPSAEAQMAAATDSSTGDIYVAGGYDGSNTLASLEVYNPSLKEWTAEQPLPTAVRQAAATYNNGKIFVFGGLANGGGVNPSVQIYSVANNSWTTAAFSAATSGSTAIAANGAIYVVGGDNAGTQAVAFNPSTLASSVLPPMPESRTGHGGAFVGNQLLEYGGYDAKSASVANTGSNYIPSSNIWGSGFNLERFCGRASNEGAAGVIHRLTD